MRPYETTVSADGRTTVPAAVRRALHLRPGDKLIWSLTPQGTVVVRAQRARPQRLTQPKGV